MNIKEPDKSMFNSSKELNHNKTEQDFHHYAYDENGELIFLQKGRSSDRKDYICLACGETMRPIMGEERDWHFRHKTNNPNCNKETYLHKLAKKLIKEKFDKEDSFFITYNVQEVCPNINRCPHHSANCSSIKRHKINLKDLYDTCEIEKTDGDSLYRADLILSSKKRTDLNPIFIEIACTHDCTPVKIESGTQIIELKVNEEKDILRPLEEAQMLFLEYENSNNPYQNCEKPVIGFYNFNRIINEKKYKSDCLYLKAKRAIKRRFDKSEAFLISYSGYKICPLREKCDLASNCDNHIINISEDLKKTYNKCDENERGEIVLSNTDKAIDPLIFKFSFDGKPQYEINQRIIEFGQFSDVKKEIKDHEIMHINLNNANPYVGYRLPSIRFYNFERNKVSSCSIQLNRFVVMKKGSDISFKILDDNVSCQQEYERPKEIVYELLFPASITSTKEMYFFGIIKARLKGIIKDCISCHYYHHRMNICKRTGIKIPHNMFGEKCRRYSLKSDELEKFLEKNYKNVPFREWINTSCSFP